MVPAKCVKVVPIDGYSIVKSSIWVAFLGVFFYLLGYAEPGQGGAFVDG